MSGATRCLQHLEAPHMPKKLLPYLTNRTIIRIPLSGILKNSAASDG
jgi:hypothetical protein